MSRAKVAALTICAFVAGGLIGAWASYEYFLREGVRGMTSLGDLSVGALYETLINLERDAGTDEDYEARLRDYLSVIARLEARDIPAEGRTSFGLSKTIALGRLALIAEKRGAVEEANNLFASAVSSCAYFRTGGCSVEKVREWAAYFDKGRSAVKTTPNK